MGWIEDKVATWARLIEERAGAGATERVLAGHEGLAAAVPRERAAWSCRAMARLADEVPNAARREAIMTARACVFAEEFGDEPRQRLRGVYRETRSLDAVIVAMAADAHKFGAPRREGDVIYETKRPADGEAFAAARTPYEKQVAACYCPLARAATTPVPAPYCCCGGGWYKGIWEFITERPARVEVVASLMRGDDACTFAVHIGRG